VGRVLEKVAPGGAGIAVGFKRGLGFGQLLIGQSHQPIVFESSRLNALIDLSQISFGE